MLCFYGLSPFLERGSIDRAVLDDAFCIGAWLAGAVMLIVRLPKVPLIYFVFRNAAL